MIDIRTALTQAVLKLGKANPDALLDAQILLGHILNKNRAYLFAHPEYLLHQEQENAFDDVLNQRVTGLPIAYITGYRDFWSHTLQVNQHTLIPRHETERMIELALELIPDITNTQVLDLGTGSGAIALALAQERPNWQITACDLSEDALIVAKKNSEALKLTHVNFIHSDWFERLPPQKFHAILSNPPYISADDPHLNQGDIRFEPLRALSSGQDGLADLQYIITHSVEWLLPNGLLLVEHGYDQKDSVGTILRGLGYHDVGCWQDLQGHDRVSGGRRPE